MEALKDFVTSKYEEIKAKVSRFENSVEDFGEALQTERKLKEFFSRKSVDLEAQLHSKNTKILKDSESIVVKNMNHFLFINAFSYFRIN